MKSLNIIILFFIFVFTNFTAWTQEVESKGESNVVVKVVDRRERPVHSIHVESANSGQSGTTNREGIFIFVNIDDSDVISVTLPRRQGILQIPVEGMSIIELALLSSRAYAYMDNDGQRIMIQPVIANPNTNASTVIDVQELLKSNDYRTLAELLKGRVPGMMGSTIRGPSTMGNANSRPLVVLDGVPIGSLNDADNMVDPRDIQTIEVIKDGAGYGTRGGAGVILIKTR